MTTAPSTRLDESNDLIQLSNLSKLFRRGDEGIRALDDVSLTIARSDFVSITGSSGSGKSTLMYILGLIDRQTSGEYRFGNRLTDSLSDSERSALRNRHFGFIFQSFHLLPRANALRNVAMPLEYAANFGKRLRGNEIDEKAKIALSRVGLSDRMSHRPNELSGGQRQRVAIARALVNDPAVIFADEPTGNLDSKNAQEILGLFESLHEESRTIVLVTHDPELARRAARQLRMSDGKIVEDRRP